MSAADELPEVAGLQAEVARLLALADDNARRMDALQRLWIVRAGPWAVPAGCAAAWLSGFLAGVLWCGA